MNGIMSVFKKVILTWVIYLLRFLYILIEMLSPPYGLSNNVHGVALYIQTTFVLFCLTFFRSSEINPKHLRHWT